MKRFCLIVVICCILLPGLCHAKDITITGVFESGTKYEPATFGYEDERYAFDDDAIGPKWQKNLDILVSRCINNACDLRAKIVPDKSGLYRGIIKSIYSIKINKSAG